MKPRHWLFLWLGLLTIVRLGYIGALPLTPDEAYYKMWADHLDVSYYSKGPGVAVAMWVGTHLFGATEFGVRFFSPLLSLGTSLLLFRLARRLFDENVALWTVLTASMIPIFNVGALLLTIDPLSIFFWTAALVTFWEAIDRPRGFNLWWPLTGLCLGLGFLCKYTNLAELISIVLLLAITRARRRDLLGAGFWSMLVVFSLAAIPPILWNARHEWITVAHLRARGGLDQVKSFSASEFFEYFGAHLGVYSPLIFLGLLAAIFWSWKKARGDFKSRFLLVFALPLLALYFFLALREAGEANWTAPAFASLIILAVAEWLPRVQRSGLWRGVAVAALTIGLVMSAMVVNTDLLRRVGLPLSYGLDPSARLRGWWTGARLVEEVRQKVEAETGLPVFLIGDRYGTAASLSFYLKDPRTKGPGHPPVYAPESQVPENQFYFWPKYDEFELRKKPVDPGEQSYYTEESGVNPFMSRDALYITDQDRRNPSSSVDNGFREHELIALFEIRRRGLPLRTLRIFHCHDYQTQPL